MFVNGKRQIRARYPNYDPSDPGKSGYLLAAGPILHDTPDPYQGSDADMTFAGEAPRGVRFDPATFTTKHWSNPTDAEINIFQEAYWGNLQWQLKGIDYTTHSIWFGEGGQQIGAKWDKNPAVVGSRSRYFIENVFEELDSPGEWFLDQRSEYSLLLSRTWELTSQSALIEVPQLESVIHFTGTQESRSRTSRLRGVRFVHTLSTYMCRMTCPLSATGPFTEVAQSLPKARAVLHPGLLVRCSGRKRRVCQQLQPRVFCHRM